jgi:hypothetical protein
MANKVTITKVSDDKFEGEHPNNIDKGYTFVGYESKPLTIGERYMLSSMRRLFRTSIVTDIDVTNNTFKTENSTYKIKYHGTK